MRQVALGFLIGTLGWGLLIAVMYRDYRRRLRRYEAQVISLRRMYREVSQVAASTRVSPDHPVSRGKGLRLVEGDR